MSKKRTASSDESSESPKKTTRKAPTKRGGTIKSQTRGTLKVTENKRKQEKNEKITLAALIQTIEPKISKDQAKKIADIDWLKDSFDDNAPSFNSMLTTIIKNVVGYPDEANAIIKACDKANKYSDIEWKFPSTLHLYIEHQKRISDLLSTEGGMVLAKACKKCGTNNWEVTYIQKAAADEIVKTIQKCLTCNA